MILARFCVLLLWRGVHYTLISLIESLFPLLWQENTFMCHVYWFKVPWLKVPTPYNTHKLTEFSVESHRALYSRILSRAQIPYRNAAWKNLQLSFDLLLTNIIRLNDCIVFYSYFGKGSFNNAMSYLLKCLDEIGVYAMSSDRAIRLPYTIDGHKIGGQVFKSQYECLLCRLIVFYNWVKSIEYCRTTMILAQRHQTRFSCQPYFSLSSFSF